ncbi:MAG: EamA family transporter [Candidatus Muiribacteriota bacterium]
MNDNIFFMNYAYIALILRIILLGYERVAIKMLGSAKNGKAADFMLFFTAILFFLPVLPFGEFPANFWQAFRLILIPAMVYSLSYTVYVRSLTIGEISLVGPLYNFNVFFLLALSVIFLGESFTLIKLAGILLMFGGASFLKRKGSILNSLKHLFSDKSCQLMILFSLLLAIGRTLDARLSAQIDTIYYAFILYMQMTFFLFLINLLGGSQKKIVGLFKERPYLSLIMGAVNAYAYVLMLIAIKQIELSVAEPATMFSLVIAMIIAWVVFGEKIGYRIIGVLIMIFGAYLII